MESGDSTSGVESIFSRLKALRPLELARNIKSHSTPMRKMHSLVQPIDTRKRMCDGPVGTSSEPKFEQ